MLVDPCGSEGVQRSRLLGLLAVERLGSFRHTPHLYHTHIHELLTWTESLDDFDVEERSGASSADHGDDRGTTVVGGPWWTKRSDRA